MYKDNSDFPKTDMQRLFTDQQNGGRSKFGEQIFAAVPKDEPDGQPNLFR